MINEQIFWFSNGAVYENVVCKHIDSTMKTFCFIRDFVASFGYSPTYTEIQAGLGFSSRGVARRRVEYLVSDGQLEIIPQTDRGIRIPSPEFVPAPKRSKDIANIEGRTCNACLEWKSVDELVKAKNYRGGYKPMCKECLKTTYHYKHRASRMARAEVKNAVRRGDIPLANTLECDRCQEKAEQYHHFNGYNQENWLDVVPLCVQCHGKAHTKS